MLTTKRSTLIKRGEKIIHGLTKKKIKDFSISLENSKVEAGSGSLPDNMIKSMAISFNPRSVKVNDLSKRFRSGSIPVVGYVSSNKFYIDLKAVLPSQVTKLAQAIKEV